MKFFYVPLLVLVFYLVACKSATESTNHEHTVEATTEPPADTVKKSIPKEEHAVIGGTHFTIRYHAPAVRGRAIWGGLVPYDDVWVTGAHSATTLEFDHAITVDGKKVPAGKYAFFTIPGREKWILILNKNWEQHLADEYDAKDDVLRVEVVPEIYPATQERLVYRLTDTGGASATMSVRWEKVKIDLFIQLN